MEIVKAFLSAEWEGFGPQGSVEFGEFSGFSLSDKFCLSWDFFGLQER